MTSVQEPLAGITVAQATAAAETSADRGQYRERLRALLPELRKVDGFPTGTDEDILILSDPPFYTTCPNPFLEDIIAEVGTPYDEATYTYHREPFAVDVSVGKTDPLYKARRVITPSCPTWRLCRPSCTTRSARRRLTWSSLPSTSTAKRRRSSGCAGNWSTSR